MAYLTTRKQFKAIKHFDHKQFDDFCKNLHDKGFQKGMESATVNIDAICEVIGTVKGIGPAKLADIREALEREVDGD